MQTRTTLLIGTVTAAAALLFGSPAVAQVEVPDPTELAGARRPYVLLIIDSSASMEQSIEGDNVFPQLDGSAPLNWGASDWRPGVPIEASSRKGHGSCFIYHPRSGCGDDTYGRPGWVAKNPLGCGLPGSAPCGWAASNAPLSDPMVEMRGTCTAIQILLGLCSTPPRLTNESQPRHVTIKEILSGEMILEDIGLLSENSHLSHGPGCWFIPRQRDASIQPMADQTYCSGVDPFENLPDFDQPFPHFQEVYDRQLSNGVIDRLSTSALFAVAAFDSFREDVDWGLNDAMAGHAPNESFRGGKREGDTCTDANGNSVDCYNLGVWRVIGPKDLSIPSSLAGDLAKYTRIAVNDTGFLRDPDGPGWNERDFTLHTNRQDSLDYNRFLHNGGFHEDFEDYANNFALGRQPIARATPIAAAIHDVYRFMAHGQGDPGDPDTFENPIADDNLRQCRPKHVVMLTDGRPEPEISDTHGESDTLNQAFGYDVDLYPYGTSEEEIASFVSDSGNLLWDGYVPSPDQINKYNPRVHVVGLNIGDPAAVLKMAKMAVAGRACAGALLPSLVPETEFLPGSNPPTYGTCVAGTGCLVPQGGLLSAGGISSYDWEHPITGAQECLNFPALILDNNDPAKLSEAIFSYMSALIDAAGLTSRTRAVVTNRLDDRSNQAGGQYRIYSGVRVGGSSWWKGVLDRTTLHCGTADAEFLKLDEQVGEQVTLDGPAPADSRRIWTSVPNNSVWCHSDAGCGDGPRPIASPANPDFPLTYDLAKAPAGQDEFGGTWLDGAATNHIVGTRVPFRADTLVDAIDSTDANKALSQYNMADAAKFRELINTYRGRIPARVSTQRGGGLQDIAGVAQDRAISGILNSNPVIVGPPEYDLPIESYRQFRAKFIDRPTMLYVSAMDGLLHAVYTGELENGVQVRQTTAEGASSWTEVRGDAADQREAWAYMPWMLRKELVAFADSQPYLVDGSPVVSDVRLCRHETASNNTNSQACSSVCQGANCTVPGAEQWRTVLVQGRGQAGAGYYAMDITRSGGPVEDTVPKMPDPILLWELDPALEVLQTNFVSSNDLETLFGHDVGVETAIMAGCSNKEEFLRSSMMGLSVSEPAIGTVIVGGQQRPIAVFGGGAPNPNATGCGAIAKGMSIYIVDLQTGSILRRFISYNDGTSTAVPFAKADPHRFSGSPALFDGGVGSVASRMFIGDDAGRMFRIDLTDPDPSNWEVDLFFDPRDAGAAFGGLNWGAAAFKPTVTLDPSRRVTVVYGTGDHQDVVTSGFTEAVFAVREGGNAADGSDAFDTSKSTMMWVQEFDDYEKLTGAPIIFNSDVYFPTYISSGGSLDESCEPGHARIWGLSITNLDPAATVPKPRGIFAGNVEVAAGVGNGTLFSDGPEGRWFGPVEPTLIRGLTVTLGEMCTVAVDDDGNLVGGDDAAGISEQQQPQLIAQTSNMGVSNTMTGENAGDAATNALTRMVTPLRAPDSQTLPLSWSLLF